MLFAFEEVYSTRVRFRDLSKRTIYLAFASVRQCSSEFDRISVGGQIHCRERGTLVRPTDMTKSFAVVLSNVLKEKIEISDLRIVWCYLHIFNENLKSFRGWTVVVNNECKLNIRQRFFLLNQTRWIMLHHSKIILYWPRNGQTVVVKHPCPWFTQRKWPKAFISAYEVCLCQYY